MNKIVDYAYIVFPNNKVCVEIQDPEVAQIYQKTFGGILYNHFPYEEYGFEDPYAFVNEWSFTNAEGNTIEYNVTDAGVVEEIKENVF